MIAYIDRHRDRYGVESICQVLPIAPSTYYAAKRRPSSARALRDQELRPRSPGSMPSTSGSTVPARSGGNGTREGIAVARCTVERLMGELGLQGVRRGKPHKTTTPHSQRRPTRRSGGAGLLGGRAQPAVGR